MSKKSLSTLKLSAAVAILAAGVGVSGITSEAAFDAPYYNINSNGGSFNGSQYTLADGTTVTDAFFCDGTYTYFLQTDGTPMKDRLTYHPDGQADHVIYFDADGHECFDTFANVKKSIAGTDVDDLCYFGSLGYLYVNVITYNKAGTAIYYANEYGVMERNGVFEVRSDATNYAALANGCKYGYANSDGTVKGFYATYEEAVAGQSNSNNNNNNNENQQGHWMYFGQITYDGNGNQISREVRDGDTYYNYVNDGNGGEYLSNESTSHYDSNGEYYGYTQKNYSLKSDGTTYLSYYSESLEPETGNWAYKSIGYYEDGQERNSTIREYSGSDILKETYHYKGSNYVTDEVTVYNYTNGKLTSHEGNIVESNYYSDGSTYVYKAREVGEYNANENLTREVRYRTNENGAEYVDRYTDYSYTTIAGEEVVSREDNYYVKSDNTAELGYYTVYGYDANGNQTSKDRYYAGGSKERWDYGTESVYTFINNKWIKTRYLSYRSSNGAKVPDYGWDKYYDDNVLVKRNDYDGTEDGQWTVTEYTEYNKYKDIVFPEDTSQIVTFEYSKTYNASGELQQYTVDFYHFEQY